MNKADERPLLKTITMTVKDDEGGTTNKITRQCSSFDDLAEVVAILKEMLLGLGYQPESVAKLFKEQ